MNLLCPPHHRIVAHIDLDCFYVAVERSLHPYLCKQPVAVVQYNPFGDLTSHDGPSNRSLEHLIGPDTNLYINSIIAVSYEARAVGVKRNMKANEAKKLCPNIILIQVPTSHGKADLSIYRHASDKIAKILTSGYPSVIVEKPSIDEFYLDITEAALSLLCGDTSHENEKNEVIENSKISEFEGPMNFDTCIRYLVDDMSHSIRLAGDDVVELQMSRYDLSKGHTETSNDLLSESAKQWLQRPSTSWTIHDQLLVYGAMIIQSYRRRIAASTADLCFTCSSGISSNKTLAKIASTMHKPNKITLFPVSHIGHVFSSLPITRVPGYNGKLGQEIMEQCPDVKFIGQFATISRDILEENLNHQTEMIQRLIDISNGIDVDVVVSRSLPKSLGCGKTFRYKNNLLLSECFTAPPSRDGNESIPKLLLWLKELAAELYERCEDDLENNQRVAGQLVVGFCLAHGKESHSYSKSMPMPSSSQQIALKAFEVVRRHCQGERHEKLTSISYLSLSATDLRLRASEKDSIVNFFDRMKGIKPDLVDNNPMHSYRIEDIDPEVLEAMPDDIRREILSSCPQVDRNTSQQPNSSKKRIHSSQGCDIRKMFRKV